jgi:ferric-dicitrate binding protein FerR (iron transport regulator)
MMPSDDAARWEALIEREAEGEKLSADERAFVEHYAAAHPEAKSELDILRGLGGALAAAPRGEAAGDRELIAQVFAQGQDLKRARFRRAAFASGLALAAGLALWFARPSVQPIPQARPTLAAPAAVKAVLAVVTPGVTLDGNGVAAGSAVRSGQKLETRAAGACLRLDRDVRACLAPGSVARIESLQDDVVISLESGALAADLGVQPAGTSFSVQNGSRLVRAIGTRFGLQIAASSAVLSVLSGTVEVRGDGASYRVSAPGRTELGSHRIDQLSPDAQRATERVLALVLPSAAAPEEAPPPESEPGAAPGRVSPGAPAPSASAESAGELLSRAREQRASGSMKDAAKAYRRLIGEHPGSAEAHTARVALGQLELSSLSNAAAALAQFTEYLRRGGPLEQEARYGQVRALAALGRAAEERRAIEAFLAKYPKAMQSAALKDRLKTLGGAGATLER